MTNKHALFSIAFVSLATLTACQSTTTEPNAPARDLVREAMSNNSQTSASAQRGELPDAVLKALLPQPTQPAETLSVARIDINAQQINAADFFAGLVQDTPYSVAIHPEVSGNITLQLKQVSLPEVMGLVAELYGFDIQQRANVFKVYPAGLRTETFAVNYLLMQRAGMTQTNIINGGVTQSQNGGQGGNNGGNLGGNLGTGNGDQGQLGGGTNGQLTNGTSINTTSETDFWKDLQETLAALVGEGEGRSVMVTPQAGLVTVRAMPNEIRDVKAFLELSEDVVQRQVILEARILEVALNDEFQQGINWQQIINNSGSTSFDFSTSAAQIGNSLTASLGGVTSLSFVNQDFSGVLSLLETQGNVQVLSSPRVTATNNQKAIIKVGDDEYFVTEISNQNTITSGSTTVAPSIELTPFFSGIALDVTPQIDEKGGVLLHVHPSVIETEEQEKVVTLNEERFVLPLAQSNIRESDTVIRAQSGEIVVIGGLMQTMRTESTSSTPLLGDIPLLGELFTNRSNKEIKKELVILLKPTVVGEGTWKNTLDQQQKKFDAWLGRE